MSPVLRDSIERVVRTAAQAAAAAWLVDQSFTLDGLKVAAVAAVVAAVTCLAGSQVGDGRDASLLSPDDKGQGELGLVLIVAIAIGVLLLCIGWLPPK